MARMIPRLLLQHMALQTQVQRLVAPLQAMDRLPRVEWAVFHPLLQPHQSLFPQSRPLLIEPHLLLCRNGSADIPNKEVVEAAVKRRRWLMEMILVGKGPR